MRSEIDSLRAHEAELRRLRQPYAAVKVVWVAPPSSGKPGNAALVTADGRIHGWVGGSCSEPVVIRESLAAMEAGLPRLVHLGKARESQREGVVSLTMSCASEGSLEIFIEPQLPAPRLVVVGRAPVVRALVDIALAIDFDVLVVEREPLDETWPTGVEVSTSLDLAGAGVGAESYVVVATFGRYDEDALGAALATGAAYVGLVASAKRGRTVLDLMGSLLGTPAEALARIHSPAGLDLGSIPNKQMAVPILAEILAERSGAIHAQPDAPADSEGPAPSGSPAAAALSGSPAAAAEAIDPVCGMTVDPATSIHKATHEGTEHAFCCGGCRQRFIAEPEAYLSAATVAG
ncbi:MAG: XdhC family protein [Acidimicrobiales bacterium]